jgi:hypothetical protein
MYEHIFSPGGLIATVTLAFFFITGPFWSTFCKALFISILEFLQTALVNSLQMFNSQMPSCLIL